MLRESNQTSNFEFDLKEIIAGVTGKGDIPAAQLLAEFADEVVKRDAAALAKSRAAVRRELGADGLVDAAAIVAAFHGFVRLADATGIPYEGAALGTDSVENGRRRQRKSLTGTR